MLGVPLKLGVLMQARRRHWNKWIPLLLTAVGSTALAAGLFVAVLTVTRAPANHRGIGLPMHGAIYVGAETCFTCHEDGSPDWTLKQDSEAVTAPVAATPGGLVEVSAHAQPPQVSGVTITSVTILGAANTAVDQHYIVATESDPLRLPSPTHPPLPASESSAQCADCHASEPTAEAIHLERADKACTLCHPSVSRVSRSSRFARAQLG